MKCTLKQLRALALWLMGTGLALWSSWWSMVLLRYCNERHRWKLRVK
jgi:hypothetical protein